MTLVGAATIAIGAFEGIGAWIGAVLVGGLLGGVATLSAIGIVASSAGVLGPSREASVDPVSGLRGLHKLEEDLEAALARPLRDSRVALYAFVLDGLKHYNDSYGEACGDAMLAWLGRKLRGGLEDRATAYRLRGAAFAVLVSGSESLASELQALSAAVLTEVGEGFTISCTAGEAVLGSEAHSAHEAIELATRRAHARRNAAHDDADRRPIEESIDAWRLVAPGYDVAALAARIGRRLGVTEDALHDLETVGHLRDVGNIAIPGAVLTRAGGLPGHEWEFIRLHTTIGERLLATNFEMEHVARLVRSSHERWDGSGYPDGLAGEAIPLASRIVFVCSAFADMTTARPHRVARDVAEALRELERGAGTQFDPNVVEAFRSEFSGPEDLEVSLTPPAWERAPDVSSGREVQAVRNGRGLGPAAHA
ncbi:MAG: HD domain-containing phosphohydrolase [Solirubrobacteraceae bacterium]